MNLTEILKAKGIGDDIIKSIQDDMKANKVFTTAEENIDIRYGKLKTDHDGVKNKLDEANKLIEDLKKSSKGNEDLQGKIAAYEAQVADLEAQLQQTKIDAAIKVGLLSEKALDVDYLTFKLKGKGSIELDENGKIKGWDDKIAALKTQLPTQFEGNGTRKYEENRLPDESGQNTSVSKEAFSKMNYQDRVKLFNENPEAYADLTK